MEAVKLFELMLREEGEVPAPLSNLHVVALLAETLAAVSSKLTRSELSRMIAVGVLVSRQQYSPAQPQGSHQESESSVQPVSHPVATLH